MISLKRDDHDDDSGGEVSEGPNSFGNAETSGGGADAAPGTPDATPSTRLAEDEALPTES